jgi:cytochrome P450
MRETLRLYPSVPKDIKTALASDVLPDGTVVTAGTSVVYLPYVMGRSPALWGEDAARFQPERFLGKPVPSAWRLPAFNGAGPRTCLGQRMALAEANFVLALVFGRFKRAWGGGGVGRRGRAAASALGA